MNAERRSTPAPDIDGTLDQPCSKRITKAFLTAPLLPALILALANRLTRFPNFSAEFFSVVLACTIVCGYALALIPGLPLFLIIKRWIGLNWLTCALGGAVSAAAPWLPWLISRAGRQPIDQLMINPLIVGAAGALGGLIFWFVAIAIRKRTRQPADAHLAEGANVTKI